MVQVGGEVAEDLYRSRRHRSNDSELVNARAALWLRIRRRIGKLVKYRMAYWPRTALYLRYLTTIRSVSLSSLLILNTLQDIESKEEYGDVGYIYQYTASTLLGDRVDIV